MGLDEGGIEPVSRALCCSEQVADGQLQTLISRAMASQGGEQPVRSGFYLHPAPRLFLAPRDLFSLREKVPLPEHQCCSQETGPFPRGGMWGEQSP